MDRIPFQPSDGVNRVSRMDYTRLPVVVLLDNVRSLYNTGAFFRTADACALEKLVLCGITPRPDQGRKQKHGISEDGPWRRRNGRVGIRAEHVFGARDGHRCGLSRCGCRDVTAGGRSLRLGTCVAAVSCVRPRDRGRVAGCRGLLWDARTHSDARSEALAQCGHGGWGGLVRTAAKAQRTPSVVHRILTPGWSDRPQRRRAVCVST